MEGVFMRYLILLGVVALASSCVQQTQSVFKGGVRAYERGEYEQAFETMATLAETGHTEAQFSLGQLYREGRGAAQNYTEALKWYCRAAAGGNANAVGLIGQMYKEGLSVPLDHVKAWQWHQLAADLGDPMGLLFMAEDAVEREDRPKDLEKGHLWLTLLFMRGYSRLGYDEKIVAYLDDLEAQMTPQQIQASNDAVKKWKPAPFDDVVAMRIKSSDACGPTLSADQSIR